MVGLKYAYGPLGVDNNGTPVYIIPVERKSRVTKIMLYNTDTDDHTIEIGSVDITTTGPDPTSFNLVIPPIKVPAGTNVTLTEDQIPALSIKSTTTSPKAWFVRTGEAISSGNVIVALEFEEN